MTAIVSPMQDWFILAGSGGKHELQSDRKSCRGPVDGGLRGRIDGTAQTTFKTYRCPTVPSHCRVFQYDKRAHMQVDGKAVTLLSGWC